MRVRNSLAYLAFVCGAVLTVGCGSSNGLDPSNDAGIDGDAPDTGDSEMPPEPPAPYTKGDPLPGWEDGQCVILPAVEAFENPKTELHWLAEGLPFAEYVNATVSPVVVDFIPEATGPAIPEIIFTSYRCFNPDGSQHPECANGRSWGVLRVVQGVPPYTTLMTLAGDGSAPNTDIPTATANLLFDAHPAAGDLNGDNHPEIVTLRKDGGVIAFKNDGSELWSVDVYDTENKRKQEFGNGAVALADLDQNGTVEVIIGNTVLNGLDGSLVWNGSEGLGKNSLGPLNCVADVDSASPGLEVIAGKTVYAADGTVLWQTNAGANDDFDGFCAVADVLDNSTGEAGRDGLPEVIRVADGKVYVHDTQHASSDWPVLWSADIPTCSGPRGAGGAPTVADFDGDGWMEIGVAGATCYAVFDRACDTDPEKCPSPSPEPGILWATQTDDSSSNVTSSTVFDFNGDGSAEVIYNDEQYFFVLSGRDGSEVFKDKNPSRTRTEQPVVADVDADGNAEIVFVANAEASFAGDEYPTDTAQRLPGVEIWSSADDAWVGARPVWNQHTYHIDNVTTDGLIPQQEAPSWTTHNTYRLNAPDDNALSSPDLGSEWGASLCEESHSYLCVQLLNYGDVLVGSGVKVSFYDADPDQGGTLIGDAVSKDSIAPGTAGESVCLDWSDDKSTIDIWVKLDSAGGNRECNEDNNIFQFKAISCADFVF
ncbi:MAG: hypothetical protein H6714_11455 [Myxococcales bacterium]|nr:hypothetical protein [Myxococcales bacterium]